MKESKNRYWLPKDRDLRLTNGIKMEIDIVFHYNRVREGGRAVAIFVGSVVRENNRGLTVITRSLTLQSLQLFYSRGLWTEVTWEEWDEWKKETTPTP